MFSDIFYSFPTFFPSSQSSSLIFTHFPLIIFLLLHLCLDQRCGSGSALIYLPGSGSRREKLNTNKRKKGWKLLTIVNLLKFLNLFIKTWSRNVGFCRYGTDGGSIIANSSFLDQDSLKMNADPQPWLICYHSLSKKNKQICIVGHTSASSANS